MDDTISRLAVIQIIEKMRARIGHNLERSVGRAMIEILDEVGEDVEKLPSAQTEQRYTEEELRVFKHGISLSLLSKRSSQYWRYDEDTATEIKFLERLYEKVSADMRGAG